MSTLTQINGDLNLGQDLAASIIIGGQTIPLDSVGLVMKFNAKLNTNKIKAKPISHQSIPRMRHTQNGWTGSVRLARINGNISALIDRLRGSQGVGGEMPQWQLAVTVKNRDNTSNDYGFKGCNLGDVDFGDYESDKYVEIEIPFEAQDMDNLSASNLNP